MKAAEIKTTTTSLQKKGQPFFEKGGEKRFFSDHGTDTSFFRKNQNTRPVIQPKLTIGQPDDKYEKEADAMADNVVQRLAMPDVLTKMETGVQTKSLASTITPLVQTKCTSCDQEEKLQKKEEDDTFQESPLELMSKPVFENKADPVLQMKCAECEKEEDIQKKEVAEEDKEIQEKAEQSIDIQRKAIFESEGEPIVQKKATPVPERNGAKAETLPNPNKTITVGKSDASVIQTKCAACEQEEKLQKKEDDKEDHDMASIQTKSHDIPHPNNASASVETGINSTKGGGSTLPKDVRSRMESSFGADFSGVRIHNDSHAVQMNKELRSQAFTHGSDIYFNAGKYDDKSSSGTHLLAHELTHTLQQGNALKKVAQQIDNKRGTSISLVPDKTSKIGSQPSIQRFAPDEEKYYSSIDSSEAARLNSFYWDFYKLGELKPLRENTPDITPVAYANRTFDAQKIMKPKLALYGKKIWVDGILGIETLVFLRYVAVEESLADIRFQISGLGFDLEALSSDVGFNISRQAIIDLLPVEFVYQWNILAPGEMVFEHMEVPIDETKQDPQWYDTILFGTNKPRHLTDDNFSLADRRKLLKLVYKDVYLSGRAAIVKTNRDFIDKIRDGQRLVSQDPDRKKGNSQWVTYGADNKAYEKKMEEWFKLEYPDKAKKIKEKIGIEEKGKKRKLTGLLIAIYIPEITIGERARIDLIVRKFLKDEEESLENFINPKMLKLIELLDDDDHNPFLLGFEIEKELNAFYGRYKVFERMASLMEKNPRQNYFELLVRKTIQAKNISALEILVQLCFSTRFKDYSSVSKAVEVLKGLKHNVQSHDYVTGDKEAQGVWLDKKRDEDHFLKVGDVTDGIYRIEETREQLKEEKRNQLQLKMTELINEHLANSLNAEEPASQQEDMTEAKFMEMILEKATQEVKIAESDIEKVLYEQAFRLKEVKKISVNGVDEFFVDYERVARTGGKGDWLVTEPSQGMRRRFDFENDLGWYRFHNMMETLETIVSVEVVIIGGAVLFFTGGGAALVALAGGGKVVALSIGISVLIYAITAEHYTIEGFLHAVLEGYLMALGFRFFTPIGGSIAKLIGTATFKQKLIGLILRSIVAGGGSGAFTNVGTMLVEDILRGKFRSPEAYLKGATVGFLLGALFDLGGSLIIGPAFRTAGRNVLERISNIQQLKEFLKNSGIILKPHQWGPEVTKSFANFVRWVNENLDKNIGSKIIAETKSKASNFLKSFAEGFELTVHRQALDLIEVGMTREAVDGLEKLIASSRSSLGKTAARSMVDDVLNQLVSKPERANTFFNLLKAADEDVMAVLLKDTGFRDLASSDAILAIAAARPAAQVNNLMRLQFGGKVNDFESWARVLLTQDDAVQKQILDILESRGSAVTPESLIRISQSGAALSDEVLEGLSRIVRKSRAAGTLDKLEEMLRLFPDDKMEAFFKTLNQLPENTFDDIIKLIDDPAQASRLLKYADDPDQLVRMLEASGNKPVELDQLFGLTKSKAPQEIESLLGRYSNDINKVTDLVKQVDGDAALLERTIARMNKTDVESILAKGQAHNVTKGDPASMQRFLDMAEKNAWADGNKIKGFIGRIHNNQAQPVKHTFSDALDRLDDFVKHHSKSPTAPAVLPGHGPLNLAAKDSIVEMTLFDGTTSATIVKPHANANNLQHYKEGHTFENFWFDPAKIDRAGTSTFWPPGTTDDMILKDLVEVLNKPACKTMIQRDFPGFAKSPPHIQSFDATEFQIGVNLPGSAEVNMFFPMSGSRAFKVSKHILHGVKDLLGL